MSRRTIYFIILSECLIDRSFGYLAELFQLWKLYKWMRWEDNSLLLRRKGFARSRLWSIYSFYPGIPWREWREPHKSSGWLGWVPTQVNLPNVLWPSGIPELTAVGSGGWLVSRHTVITVRFTATERQHAVLPIYVSELKVETWVFWDVLWSMINNKSWWSDV
jgi:hypothetical protein